MNQGSPSGAKHDIIILPAPHCRRSPTKARRGAKELGVDLGRVKGAGPDGRISEEDVRAFASSAH